MVESVAAGAEEFNSSVKEIAETMVRSKDTADSAVERVETADQSTHRLSAAAQSMGGIVDLINNITGQINLLALNATIESARAGEAGRGFAVVASEVKNRAAQAKGATEQISKDIADMRAVSSDFVGALGTIKQSIEEVREYVASTAAAVEQRSAVARDVGQHAQGSRRSQQSGGCGIVRSEPHRRIIAEDGATSELEGFLEWSGRFVAKPVPRPASSSHIAPWARSPRRCRPASDI